MTSSSSPTGTPAIPSPAAPGGCYAGIGSRRTPSPVLAVCEQVARALAQLGWRLRSGHAPGADQAFERGAQGGADIFLPWPTFEDAIPVAGRAYPQPAPAAYRLASQHHPSWSGLGRGARARHARNCHQILGWTLEQPARFAICWTPDGSLDGHGRDSGGTGHALRLCAAHNVPVFNLARPDHHARITHGLDLHPTPGSPPHEPGRDP